MYGYGGELFRAFGHDYGVQVVPIREHIGPSIGGSRIVSVDLGIEFFVALDVDGNVFSWGMNNYGQLGLGRQFRAIIRHPSHVVAASWNNVARRILSISAGDHAVIALDLWGNIWVWGDNTHGQLLNNTIEYSYYPIILNLPNRPDIHYISMSSFGAYAMDSLGRLWVWGDNRNGCLGLDTLGNRMLPVVLVEAQKFVGGFTNFMIIDMDGFLWMWGSGFFRGVFGLENTSPIRVRLMLPN